ncbi:MULTISPECIES: HAD family phosphatase [unclassified Variovorax]|uniref:HAD family hydrolase n=1 Tax=unclassified Variovorax TaxID=663243 RepID=UPI002574A2D0|nr:MULTISPECIES: HAD family phosphatase [unclassified Variovorax]MDM0088835.1 HAD family phosphatase [Variovorax sp. J22G40]MDM0146908.1 HAD family phosphatase [Variovorax sp. J2P1-31]
MARTDALIFDMDGTMVDSMPWHAKAWIEFARRRGLALDVPDLMRRTTGRNAFECACELMEREVSVAESDAITHEKESIYRELFGAVFAEVAGFNAFASAAAARGLKIAVGTAGDRHNVAFVMERLHMDPLPLAIVGGDEGFTGKPTPAIFLEAARRIGVAPAHCIVFEDAPFGIEAARRAGMRAVAVCTTHSAAELAGPHVIAAVRDYEELALSNFLETLDAATA